MNQTDDCIERDWGQVLPYKISDISRPDPMSVV